MAEHDAIVFVVEDDPPNRDALERLIRAVGYPVQTFGSAEEFLRSKRPDVPACLVLDIRLPGLSGLELQRALVEARVQIPIIFLTAYGDVGMSVQAMKAGAVEFLSKPICPKRLVDAVPQAIERDRTARAERLEILKLRQRFDSLTPREQQVMELVVAGRLNKQTAAELGTSEITVKIHRGRLMRKMQAESLPDLVRMAHRLGIQPVNDLSRHTNV
jgi:FixJ family two-component response regulator